MNIVVLGFAPAALATLLFGYTLYQSANRFCSDGPEDNLRDPPRIFRPDFLQGRPRPAHGMLRRVHHVNLL